MSSLSPLINVQLDVKALEQSIEHFFAFHDELASLLGHPIDLVWYPGLRNPYFKAEVEETKKLIYDAEGEKISV